MKKEPIIKFSKEVLKDLKIIAMHHGMKTSDLTKNIETNFNILIQRKKSMIIKELESLWFFDKITTSEFKRLGGEPKAKIQEKISFKRDSETYKENAKKALLMKLDIRQ